MIDTRVIIYMSRADLTKFLSIANVLNSDGTGLLGMTEEGKKWVKENKFEFFNSFKVANDMMNSVDVMELSVSVQVYTALEIINSKDF